MAISHSPRSRRRAGATQAEYIIIVTVVAIAGLSVVTAFGNSILRKFRAAVKSLDEGKPNDANRYTLGNVSPLNAIAPKNAVANLPQVTPTNQATVPPNYIPGPGRPGGTPHYSGGTLGNPSGWDPVAILGGLTQDDARNDTVFDAMRCTRTSHLAAAVMCGPDAVRRIVDDLARQIQQGRQPFAAGNGLNPIPPDRALEELGRIRDRLDSTSFDNNDSGMLLEIMSHYYQAQSAGNPNGVEGLWPSSMTSLGNPATRAVPQGPMNRAQFQQVVNGLQPGEAIRHVINNPSGGGSAVPSQHTTLIGRDANGRLYAYDPGTQPGGQIFYSDTNPAQFNYYLNNTGGDGQYYVGGSDDLAAPAGTGGGAPAIRFC